MPLTYADCCRGWRAACRADSGAQLNSVDEILEGISNKGAAACWLHLFC